MQTLREGRALRSGGWAVSSDSRAVNAEENVVWDGSHRKPLQLRKVRARVDTGRGPPTPLPHAPV